MALLTGCFQGECGDAIRSAIILKVPFFSVNEYSIGAVIAFNMHWPSLTWILVLTYGQLIIKIIKKVFYIHIHHYKLRY